MLKYYLLPGFPYYNDQMYTEDGQPYYSTFMKDEQSGYTFLDDRQLREFSNDLKVPRRLANHLFADGPLKVSLEAGEGITDLEWFITASDEDK